MKRYAHLLIPLGLMSCASTPFYEQVPTVPINVSPSPAVDVRAGVDTEFVWMAAERVDYYEFHIFNRQNADINQYYMHKLEPAAVCSADRCSVRVKVDLPVMNQHAWRVRAVNNAGASNWTRSLINIVTK